MNIIRYAIRKDDLHNLLRTIGVLQQSERLLAVNNVDLADSSHDAVIVTVSAGGLHSKPEDLASWTDKEIEERYVELSILEDAATRQLRMVVEEMNLLRVEKDNRSLSTHRSENGIPGAVELNIREQLRALLGGGG
ncbi:MAG: hypothetical protein WBQ23_05855 [Bacteroidota bacterium]